MIILLNEFTSTEMNEYKIYRNNIYAGLVAKNLSVDKISINGKDIKIEEAKKMGLPLPILTQTFRKILFSKTEDNKAEDLLFWSLEYNVDNFSNDFNKENIHINNIVYLGNLLKENNFNEILSNSDIKKIYKLFLKSNSKFYKKKHLYLPITSEDYTNLQSISELSRFPSEQFFNNFNDEISFKPKVKMFTKK